MLPLISTLSSISTAWTESWLFPADSMNSTGFPSPSTIACSFVFNQPLVRPTASSAVFSPSVSTFVNLDAGKVQTQAFLIRICRQCAKYGFQCTIVPTLANRAYTDCRGPSASGSSRHCAPLRTIQNIPLSMFRSSFRGRPRFPAPSFFKRHPGRRTRGTPSPGDCARLAALA